MYKGFYNKKNVERARIEHFIGVALSKEKRRQEKIEYYKSTGHASESILNPDYPAIHNWLHKEFGKATKCENKKCEHKSKNFEWCKRRDASYDFKIENFVQLCRRCHRKLDSKFQFNQVII